MTDDEEELLPFEEALEEIDVKYIDGDAYISIHTICQMNATIARLVDEMHEDGADFEEETVGVLLWIMKLWQDLHNLLELEETKRNIPDTPEALLDGTFDEKEE